MPKRQKSGLYRTHIKVGVDENGKDVFKYISGHTKKELEQHRQEAIDFYIGGHATKADRLFGEYATQWYQVRKQPTISPSSQESYRIALNNEILPQFGNRMLRSIQPMELQDFINRYAGASQTRITVIYAALRGIFASACLDRILEHNPTEHLTKPEATPPAEKRALTVDERARLEAACQTSPHGAYLAVMYYLGLRPGEARGLMWGDFDWQHNTVHIQRDIDYKDGGKAGALKTEKSERTIPVPNALRAILLPLREMPNVYLFRGQKSGAPLAKSVAERMWVELMLDAGMVRERRPGEASYGKSDIRSQWAPLITAHALRHNFITMCWERGLDAYTVKRLVGHSSITTTMDTYTHLSDRQLVEVGERLNSMFNDGQNKSCTKVAQGGTGEELQKEEPAADSMLQRV